VAQSRSSEKLWWVNEYLQVLSCECSLNSPSASLSGLISYIMSSNNRTPVVFHAYQKLQSFLLSGVHFYSSPTEVMAIFCMRHPPSHLQTSLFSTLAECLPLLCPNGDATQESAQIVCLIKLSREFQIIPRLQRPWVSLSYRKRETIFIITIVPGPP
jgi:hypothetical protein